MATEKDLEDFDQGSKYQLVIDVTGLDLTGYSARGMVRADRVSAAVLADWASYLSVNAVAKQVVLSIPADVMAGYNFDRGRYDIEVFKVGDLTSPVRIMQGNIKLDREVTR